MVGDGVNDSLVFVSVYLFIVMEIGVDIFKNSVDVVLFNSDLIVIEYLLIVLKKICCIVK